MTTLLVIGTNLLAAIGLGWVLFFLWPIVILAVVCYFFLWLQRQRRQEVQEDYGEDGTANLD